MPTARPRYAITETDEVARALDEAAKAWPEASASPRRLLLLLVEEGYRAIRQRQQERVTRRRAAIARTHGALAGLYPDDYLARLRDEWPE